MTQSRHLGSKVEQAVRHCRLWASAPGAARLVFLMCLFLFRRIWRASANQCYLTYNSWNALKMFFICFFVCPFYASPLNMFLGLNLAKHRLYWDRDSLQSRFVAFDGNTKECHQPKTSNSDHLTIPVRPRLSPQPQNTHCQPSDVQLLIANSKLFYTCSNWLVK